LTCLGAHFFRDAGCLGSPLRVIEGSLWAMAFRCRVVPLCSLLLAPSLAWAAPADDRPPVQRPSKPVSEATETTVEAQAPEAPEGEGATPVEPTTSPAPDAETAPPISADPPSD